MENFENVGIVKKGNMYFDGKVNSRTIIFPSGEKKTLGFMQIGEYEFNTNEAETMEIQSGRLTTCIADADVWIPIVAGEKFSVPANSKFKMKVEEATDYICSFIK